MNRSVSYDCENTVNNLLFVGQWSEEYARIIHRFRNIISAQFFGHTHFDEFEIFFGDNEVGERIPTNMAYLAPSMTTIDNLNPAYRIFMIDGKIIIKFIYLRKNLNQIQVKV